MSKIKLTKKEIKKCEAFANAVVGTNVNEYKKRNQSNKPKIIEDIKIGKIAELGVYHYMRHRKKQCSYPDFKIYHGTQKSFASDLQTNELDIHVKSQKSTMTGDMKDSWLFQPEDPLVTKPNEKDVIVLCTVDENTVYTRKWIKGDEALKYYEPPVLDKLKPFKKALYLNTIEGKKSE